MRWRRRASPPSGQGRMRRFWRAARCSQAPDEKYGIPTAGYEVFEKPQEALDYIRKQDTYPAVIKADGLALGKGVILCDTYAEAEEAVKAVSWRTGFRRVGQAGVVLRNSTDRAGGVRARLCRRPKTVIEYNCRFGIPDGFPPPGPQAGWSLTGDEGPNTGGMGIHQPLNPHYVLSTWQRTPIGVWSMDEALPARPFGRHAEREGRPFKGCLFFGLMLTPDGPLYSGKEIHTGFSRKVIEYNCRYLHGGIGGGTGEKRLRIGRGGLEADEGGQDGGGRADGRPRSGRFRNWRARSPAFPEFVRRRAKRKCRRCMSSFSLSSNRGGRFGRGTVGAAESTVRDCRKPDLPAGGADWKTTAEICWKARASQLSDAALKQLESSVEMAKSTYESAKENLGHPEKRAGCRLCRDRFGGRGTSSSLMSSAGITVKDDTAVYAEITLGKYDIARVQAGQKAKISVPSADFEGKWSRSVQSPRPARP